MQVNVYIKEQRETFSPGHSAGVQLLHGWNVASAFELGFCFHLCTHVNYLHINECVASKGKNIDLYAAPNR